MNLEELPWCSQWMRKKDEVQGLFSSLYADKVGLV